MLTFLPKNLESQLFWVLSFFLPFSWKFNLWPSKPMGQLTFYTIHDDLCSSSLNWDFFLKSFSYKYWTEKLKTCSYKWYLSWQRNNKIALDLKSKLVVWVFNRTNRIFSAAENWQLLLQREIEWVENVKVMLKPKKRRGSDPFQDSPTAFLQNRCGFYRILPVKTSGKNIRNPLSGYRERFLRIKIRASGSQEGGKYVLDMGNF